MHINYSVCEYMCISPPSLFLSVCVCVCVCVCVFSCFSAAVIKHQIKVTHRRKSLSRTYSFKGLVSVTITVRNMAAVGRQAWQAWQQH